MALSHNEKRFVSYVISQHKRNLSAAFAAVFGQDVAFPGQRAHDLLIDRPEVAAALDAAEEQRARDMALTAADVLRDAHLVATTSPNELVEWHIGCCHYCHGLDHLYQRTPREFREAMKEYHGNPLTRRDDPLALKFDVQGGIGYDAKRPPHPDCPECFGEGVGRCVMKDTRLLSEGAHKIYGGVKMTKNGPEIQLRDRKWAVDLAARAVGLSTGNLVITPGATNTAAAAVAVAADPVAAGAAYADLMGKTS